MSRRSVYEVEEHERPDFIVDHPATTTADQIAGLTEDLKRTEADFLHLPFRSVDAIVSGIPTGELWYIGAFSGDGKTTFLTSLTLGLMDAGLKVYYLPTETPGKVVRGHLACKALGYDIGDFQSGEYLKWPDAQLAAQRVRQEAKKYGSDIPQLNMGTDQKVWIAKSGFLYPHTIEAEYSMAAEMGADVVIVDHGDHTEQTDFETSAAVQKQILMATQEYDVRSLVSTQFNLEAVKGNRALRYMAPRESYVYMGNTKRHVCNGMLGIYRPLKLSNLDLKQLEAFKAGSTSVTAKDILEPNMMAVHCMKHRKYGAREGERSLLHFRHGKVQDFDPATSESLAHGISSTQRSLV